MAFDAPNNQSSQINGNMLRACFAFGLGWLAWQMHSPDLFFMQLIAILFVVGGARCLILALVGYGQLFGQIVKLSRFKRKGAKPKSDTLASEKALRDGGLLK